MLLNLDPDPDPDHVYTPGADPGFQVGGAHLK